MRRALPPFLAACVVPFLLPACADTGEPRAAALDPCLTTQAPLLGCPPAPPDPDFTIEDACQKMIDCGRIAISQVNDNGDHYGDFPFCISLLRGDEFTAERLHFTLHCVEVSTCQDLSQPGPPFAYDWFAIPCFQFAGNP